MKRWKKVLLSVLLIIVVFIAGVAIWQRDNVKAVMLYLSNSKADISVQMTQQRDQTQKVLSGYQGITVRDFTPEEEEAIINGTLSLDDAIKKINGESTGGNQTPSSSQGAAATDKPADTNKDSASQTTANTTPSQNRESSIINRYLSKIYGIKGTFLGKLSGVKSSASKEFYSLPAEKRTESRKRSIMADHVMQCYELESQCDSQIEAVLSSMQSELQAIGAGTSIIGEIRSAYQNEKSIKKAYYLSMLS